MSFAEALERRSYARMRRQLPYKLLVDGRCHRGTVWDFSEQSLFLRTSAELAPGDGAVVSLHTSEGRHFVLEATVLRNNATSLTLARLASPCVALRILNPPAAWLDWIRDLEARGVAPASGRSLPYRDS